MNAFGRHLPVRGIIALVAVVMLGSTGGCGLRGAQEAGTFSADKQVEYEAAEAPSPPAGAEAPMEARTAGVDSTIASALPSAGMTAAQAAPIDRKVIKTADLDVEVEDIDGATTRIRELVDSLNGFVESATVTSYDTSRQAEITARVPSAHFREVYDAVKALGKVNRDHIGGQDVTEEYIDLERRIANLQAQEKRVREMFNEAETVEDLLKIEQRLTEVRGQIESLQGRLHYLKDRVSFSTFTITLNEPGEAPIDEPEGWKIGYHLRGAWMALVRAFRGLVYGVIWIAVAGAVVWIPLVIVIWLIRRWALRRRAARESAERQTTLE